MDWSGKTGGADEAQGVAHQQMLQELMKRDPTTARAMAAGTGMMDYSPMPTGAAPDQARMTANFRNEMPRDYYGWPLYNMERMPAGTPGRTLADILRAMGK